MMPNMPVTVRPPRLRAQPSAVGVGAHHDKARAKVAVRLVVVEEHATTLDLEVAASEAARTVFVRQLEGELSSDFTRRVAKQIALVERSGQRLGSAVIALAPCVDDAPQAARYLLACLLLAHAGLQRGPEELVLVVDGTAGVSVRQSVMGLVEALVCESGAAFIPIRARFHPESTGGHAPSGIRAIQGGNAKC